MMSSAVLTVRQQRAPSSVHSPVETGRSQPCGHEAL